MKKLISLLLCLTLVMSLGCAAFASGEASGGSDDPTGGLTSTTTNASTISLSDGERIIDGETIEAVDGSAIQHSGTSVVVVKNSSVTGTTTAATEPLTGNPGNLLVAGSIRTTLALGQSQAYYINSAITSQNWAALSTDGAVPAQAEGEKELSLYAYGSDAITTEGGYGAYSDLFCNLYSYGSLIQAAEIGIISGTYGKVTVGTIADGEADPDMAAYLTEADTTLQSDKNSGSLILGGRNAIMIHSVNLPPYWEYEGYSQEELPLYSTPITVNGSTLQTDLSIDMGIAYEAQKQAYIDHTAGSVILVKSTNTVIDLVNSQILPGEGGTGAILHTVYNNDTMFMNAVPDGDQYPGVVVNMTDMAVSGDVIHEDYQRDLHLNLDAAEITGAINGYDCDHWNEVAAAEGFTDYALDASYETAHGVYLTLSNGSVWNVTAESTLAGLECDASSTVNGTITENADGTITVSPAVASGDATAELASAVHIPGVSIMDMFTLDVDLTFADQGNGVKTFVIEFEGKSISGSINMGVWTPDSGDTNEADICSCVQAAYEAMTGAGGV